MAVDTIRDGVARDTATGRTKRQLRITQTGQNAGSPSSGPLGTLNGIMEAGELLVDTTHGVMYVNEGTKASPYWTPIPYDHPGLFSVNTDFRDEVGEPLANTAVEKIVPGSGLRIFGQGLDIADSGVVVQTAGLGGGSARLTTTASSDRMVAIGMEQQTMQPDTHGGLAVDVELTHVTAITARAMFVGFIGTSADALARPVTGAATTATFVQNDVQGVFFDTGLTSTARLYGVHRKSAEAPGTQDLTADGDTATDIAAVGTYQRIRVEISAAGVMKVFVNKVQVYTRSAAAAPAVPVSPVVYLSTLAAAVKSMDVRRFATWASRV